MVGLSLELPKINTGPFVFTSKPTGGNLPIPADWRERILALFSAYFWYPWSAPHEALWDWENDIVLDSTPRPFVGIWPRGRGKSTTAEAVVSDLGVRQARTYCMYVSGTQAQADKHVQTIARMLESNSVARYAPDIGKPRVSKNGNRTWNRQTVTTATGYTVEAIGLDRAVRGQKIDWARPDAIVFDDIDERHDSEATTTKKGEIITDSIIPAGSVNCAVLFMQNLIHSASIASQLAKRPDEPGAAHYLLDRIVSGPFKAVDGLQVEQRQVGDLWRWEITEGKSLWNGYDLDVCEDELNRVGPASYTRESQNDVDSDDPDALMSEADFERTRVTVAPALARIAIAVDPPGGATECGIVCGGRAKIGNDWHGFTLEDATQPKGVTPERWALEVLKCYYRNQADVIFVERNYGGDMATAVIRQTKWLDDDGKALVDGAKVHIVEVVATRGKLVRAEPVATVFQQGRGHHVGNFPALEKEWRQYVPGDKDSPNRLDAEVWMMTGLELTNATTAAVVQSKVRGRGGQGMIRRSVRRVA